MVGCKVCTLALSRCCVPLTLRPLPRSDAPHSLSAARDRALPIGRCEEGRGARRSSDRFVGEGLARGSASDSLGPSVKTSCGVTSSRMRADSLACCRHAQEASHPPAEEIGLRMAGLQALALSCNDPNTDLHSFSGDPFAGNTASLLSAGHVSQ